MKIGELLKLNLKYILIWIALSAVFVLFVFPNCSADYINYDSAYQYFLTQHSMAEIWELLPLDYSPPLYAVLLKLYTMVFGNTLYAMRTFSLFAVAGMLWLALFPVRTALGEKTSLVCTALVFGSATVLKMLPEIRPTIFAMFFMMAIAIYAYIAFFQGKKYSYVCLTVFSILGMYTHNITMLGALGIYAVVLLFSLIEKDGSKFKNFLLSGCISAVAYIPWLTVVFKQFGNVQDNFWSTTISMETIINWLVYNYFNVNNKNTMNLTLALVSIIIICVAIMTVPLSIIKKNKKNEDSDQSSISVENKNEIMSFAFLLCEIVLPFVVLIAFHYICYPLVSERYVFIYGILLSIILAEVVTRYLHKYITVAYCLAVAVNCINNNIYLDDAVSKCDLYDLVKKIENESSDGDIAFLHTHEYYLGLMSYYFPDAKHYVCDETFTVLNSYEVFTTDVIDIGSVENIWNYTNEFYLWNDFGENKNSIDDDYFSLEEAESALCPDNVESENIYRQIYTYYDWISPYKLTKEATTENETVSIED